MFCYDDNRYEYCKDIEVVNPKLQLNESCFAAPYTISITFEGRLLYRLIFDKEKSWWNLYEFSLITTKMLKFHGSFLDPQEALLSLPNVVKRKEKV